MPRDKRELDPPLLTRRKGAPMPAAQRLSIEGSRQGQLAARLDLPEGEVRAYALFAHCFTCSKDSLAARRIAAELSKQGIAVVRFDFTGLGDSGGEFASTNFSSNVDDVVAVCAHVERLHGPVQLLIGYSLGGAAVLCAATRLDGLRGIVTIGAPADAEHVVKQFGADVDRIESDGEAEVRLAGRPFTIRREFLDDVRTARVEDHLRKMRVPLMIMHSPKDQIVSIDNATRIFGAARHPKSFVSLHDADHLLTSEKDARFVASVVGGWFSSRLEPETSTTSDPSEEDGITVSETGTARFQNVVHSGPHRFFADEPRSVGGTDSGPSPYDLLAAALAACTSMTLRMYAERKGYDLGPISVTVHHDRIHAQDCEECAAERREAGGSLDRFTRRLSIKDGPDEEIAARLLEIADKCPVHRSLERGASVVTSWKGEALD